MHHNPYMGGPQGWSRASPTYDLFNHVHNPFLSSLDVPNLAKLNNDPIILNPLCPPMSAKLPSDIHEFKGKLREHPSTNITMYHLWFSSNSLLDDLIKLCLFQRTLNRDVANGTSTWTQHPTVTFPL